MATGSKLQCREYKCMGWCCVLPPQIFVQSLLCSGKPQNIQLAAKMVERSSDGPASLPHWGASGTAHRHSVDYEKALQLVLSSATEYFNSAAHLTDQPMELARWESFLSHNCRWGGRRGTCVASTSLVYRPVYGMPNQYGTSSLKDILFITAHLWITAQRWSS